MKSNWRIWLTVLAVLLLGVFALDARTSAVAQQDPNGPTVQSSDPVTPKLSPALRDLPQTIPERKLDREEINPKKNPGLFLPDFGLTGTDTKNQDPLAPNGVNSGYTPAPIFTFEGQGNFNMYTPPDTTGDVGPNHYVQMVNVQTAVYNKSGTFLGSWPNNALWTGFGGPCENDNDGDPIVLYDDMADRWMLSQFAISTGLEQCVAISTTPDPTGTYYLYDFPMPDFPDYPKLGVWPDGYYMGTNTGYPNQYYAHVLDRASMLAGAPATRQSVGGNANFLMPADADGPTPPPAGMPGTFYTFYDGGYPNHPAGVDRLAIYEFDVDWATPANSTFGLVTELPIAGFNYTVCGFFAGDCVPQPAAAGGQKLDTVDPWPMVRLQYRNFGGYQAMVGNFTVDVDGTDWAGIRWFELRNPGAGWTLRQEGTFAPDADHRFMGSIAMDGSGNIALGYSVSSSSTNPAIRYTIHTMGDPLGTMQAEASMFEGGGVNQGPYDRWGDYSAMVVDPTDQCTFWYTNEYHDVPESSFMWNTRIGTFKVPGCTGGLGPTGTLDGNVYDSVTMTGIAGADIQATSPITYSGSTTSDANGDYAMMLPEYSGYDVTGSAYGYVPNTITSVGVVSGTTTTLDIPLTLATFYTVDGVVTDVNTGWPLYANIDINGYPGDSIWSDPETGYYSISLPEGITYTFDVAAWVPGYLPGGGDVGPLTADATENFALDVDVAACVAPGYTLDVNGTFSDFEGGVPPAGWTVVDNAGNGVVWTTIAGSGESGNYTNGSGEAATVSSDAFGTADFDTELQTNVFDTTGWPGMTLEYTVNYQNYANEDFLDVDISTDGGATWTNVLSWNEDHGAFRATPGEDVSLDLSANVGFANTVLRWHYYDPALDDWEWYAQIDDVLLGNVSCLPPADGGLVVGNVYDDNTLDALNGAMVDNKDGYTAEAVATPFDLAVDDAFYTIFSPSGSKTFTATLSGYATDVQSVTVVISDTVAQDFYLGAGWLDADPDSLHVTLDMGISTTVSLNLDNLGSAAADFDLQEVDDGFQPALVLSIPASDGNFPRGNAAPSAGAAPIAVMEGGVPLSDLLAPLGTVAYATEAANSFHTAFDLDVPEVLPNLGAFVPANFPGAGEFVNGLVYVADTGNIMYELDPATGAVLDTYPVTAPPGGETYSGMALDPTSGMVYASSTNISTSSIFTVDVETGIATLIGPITGSACNIAIAIDGTGQIYGYDICTDDFWAIDKNTGAGTSIGSIGFDANFGQGMGWDPATDQIYLVAFNSGTSQVELRIADRVTGNTVLMGVLGSTNPGGLVQLPWLGVPIGVDTDIPWLSEDPITGTISAAGTQMIDVTFDAGVPEVTQPGDYHATLKVKNDTPYGTLSVPVTMTVDTPADWGKLEGTVTGLGYCDLDPAALEDAEVIITDSGGVTSTLMTDPNGYFSRWLDEAGSPYAIGVSAAEHEVGYASGVSVSGGVTTTVDFDLRWLQPCVSVDPETYEVTVAQGYSTTVGLDIDNAGAVSTTFELVETNGGFVTTTLFVDMPGRSLDNNSMAKSGPETPSEREAYSFIMGPVTLSANTFDVLILTPDGDVSVLSAALAPFTDLSVTVWDAGTNGEPSVADLLAFDVVILGNDLLWNNMDKTIVGNNLADYIDQGGKIIEGLYIQSFDNWGFAGRYMTDGYSPFTLASLDNWNPDTLNTVDPSHPVMAGVASVNDNWGHQDPGLSLDAMLLASWTTSGYNYIAVNDNVVALNQVLHEASNWTGDVGIILHNSVLWLAGGDTNIPWLSEDPITGTVSADSIFTVDVTFDTMTYTLGTYTGTLKVNSDDPINGTVEVPVTMYVVDVLIYGVELSGDDALSGDVSTIVTYTLSVTNTGNIADTFTIAISDVWGASAPASIMVVAGATGMFDVAVPIPAGAIGGDFDVASVTVTSVVSPTFTDSADLTTTANAFYGVELSGDTAMDGGIGTIVNYTLSVTNTGNVADTFTIAISDTWGASAPVSIMLNVGATDTFDVVVTVPAGAANGDFDVAAVTVTSQGDPAESDSADLTTTANTVYGVDLSGDDALTGEVGTIVTYALSVTNTGNVADTFTIAISDAWGASAPASILLNAGATGTFDVAVPVPAGAADGDFDAATVTVTSLASSAATDSAVLTTTAEINVYLIYLPIVTK